MGFLCSPTRLFCVLLMGTSTAVAQDWAKPRLENSPRHLEFVPIKAGPRTVESFVAFPEVKDKAPAVVVIHEIFGLTDWVRGVADQLAEAGAIAVAPDLLSGMGPNQGGTASFAGGDAVRRSIVGLKAEQIATDLDAVVEYARQLPACNGKVLVVGFCWGGSQSFRYATHNPRLAAAMVFYGSGPTDADSINRIACPVYGFYGGNDARVNATIPGSTTLMKAGKKTFEPIIYDAAGHGFLRAGEMPDANAANKKAREDAWVRIKQIVAKHGQ